MHGKSDRIIIDTNLWIHFLITKKYSQLDKLLLSNKIIILFSDELLDEFIEVITRPRLRKYFTVESTYSIIDNTNDYSEFIKIKSQINVCRDKKDNFLLALAHDGKADYLITRDNDLLVLQRFGKTRIITISEYLQKKSLR